MTPDDPSFIGCWWLAYLIFGALVLFSAIPMLFCPKHLPHYYKMKIRLRKLKKLRKLPSIEDVKPRGLKQKTKGNFLTSVSLCVNLCSSMLKPVARGFGCESLPFKRPKNSSFSIYNGKMFFTQKTLKFYLVPKNCGFLHYCKQMQNAHKIPIASFVFSRC